MTDDSEPSRNRRDVVLLVDVANVVGSRPDGWWRDRVAATERVLPGCAALPTAEVTGPDGDLWRVTEVVAVLEGQANKARVPNGVTAIRAEGSGDDAIAATADALSANGVPLLVVTADRGLRARLPGAVHIAGPGWLRALLDDASGQDAAALR